MLHVRLIARLIVSYEEQAMVLKLRVEGRNSQALRARAFFALHLRSMIPALALEMISIG